MGEDYCECRECGEMYVEGGACECGKRYCDKCEDEFIMEVDEDECGVECLYCTKDPKKRKFDDDDILDWLLDRLDKDKEYVKGELRKELGGTERKKKKEE